MTLTDAIAYHRWATLHTLESCAALSAEEFHRSLGGSFASPRDTLAHALAADRTWARRIRGETVQLPGLETLPVELDVLRSEWITVLDDLSASLEARDGAELVTYRNFENRLEDIVFHVVNHGSYHRGQVVTMLRQLGHTPVGTDWLLFTRRPREV